MKKFVKVIAAASMIITLYMMNGCSFQKAEVAVVKDSCEIPGDTVSYKNDIVPILTTYCTDPSFGICHQRQGGIGFDYTTYEGIKYEVDNHQLEQRVLILKDMPPANSAVPLSLTTCDLKKIEFWIAEGGGLIINHAQLLHHIN